MGEKQITQEQKEITKEDLATEAYLNDTPLSTNIFDEFFDGNQQNPEDKKGIPYTTELLDDKTLKPLITVDEAKELIKYLEGSGRPEFMDKMMTGTNEKLIETVKVMTILYLNKIPKLLEYQRSIQENLLTKESISSMNYSELSKTDSYIQKEINDLLSFGLNVAKTLSNVNTMPTKVEKLSNAILNLPESTLKRIEEIVRMETQG